MRSRILVACIGALALVGASAAYATAGPTVQAMYVSAHAKPAPQLSNTISYSAITLKSSGYAFENNEALAAGVDTGSTTLGPCSLASYIPMSAAAQPIKGDTNVDTPDPAPS